MITIGSQQSLAGALTDDHQWLVLTTKGGQVYVYTFNGSEFVFKESLGTFPGEISYHLSLTNDHLYMAFIVEHEYGYVYKYNGTNFTLYARMTETYRPS